MPGPVNPELTQSIMRTDFFAAVEQAAQQRFYPKLSVPKTQTELTVVYPSLGSVPELRQVGGLVGGGSRSAVILKDWKLTATLVPWEQTVWMARADAESMPNEVSAKASQMAAKGNKSIDRLFCEALVATTAGYDTVSLINNAHPESGTNQDNARTTAAVTATDPTAPEVEASLDEDIGVLKAFTDDQGTPLNEGIEKFTILCHPDHEFAIRTVTSPLMANQAVDSSGVTGRYRGLADVIVSAYCTSTGKTNGVVDRMYVFANGVDKAMAFCKLKDLEFNTNFRNENSDAWVQQLMLYMTSYGIFAFVPWRWSSVIQHIWS